jgi:hypothetical protein
MFPCLTGFTLKNVHNLTLFRQHAIVQHGQWRGPSTCRSCWYFRCADLAEVNTARTSSWVAPRSGARVPGSLVVTGPPLPVILLIREEIIAFR